MTSVRHSFVVAELLRRANVPTAPPIRPTEVLRSDLIDSLDRFGGPVALVSAPAGYGKSTLAAQWCRAQQRPVIWLTASTRDDDGVEFVSRLLIALHAVSPLDDLTIDTLEGPPNRLTSLMLPALLDNIAERGPLVIAIDDVHRLRSRESTDLLHALASSVEAPSVLLLVGRTEPDIGIGRLRVAGDILEITAEHLAMDSDTTRQVLDRMGGPTYSDHADRIAEVTEGWPAGIGMIGHDRSGWTESEYDASSSAFAFTEYFLDEVLAGLPESTVEFVRRTAVFDRFCADMADEVLGRSDSAQLVRALERSNMFMVPLDAAHEWFRYHHLFSDALRSSPGRIGRAERRGLRTRAARWHLTHGTEYEALELAQASGDIELFGEVTLRVIHVFLLAGKIKSLRTVLERSSDADIMANTGLSLNAAHLYSRFGEMDRARMFLRAAAIADDLDRHLPRSKTSYRTLLAMTRNAVWQEYVSEMLADGLGILDDPANQTSSRWLTSGYRIAGCALVFQGRTTEAVEMLEHGLVTAGSDRNLADRRLLIGGYLICALLDERRHAEAARRWDELRDHAGRYRATVPSMAMSSYVGEAGVLLHRGDHQGARRALTEAHTLLLEANTLPLNRADLATRAAELASALRDTSLRASCIDIAHSALRGIVDSGEIANRLQRVAAVRVAPSTPLDLLTPAERRVLALLSTHRTQKEIGESLFVSRSTVKTHVSSIYSKFGVTTRSSAVEIYTSTIAAPAVTSAR